MNTDDERAREIVEAIVFWVCWLLLLWLPWIAAWVFSW